MLQYVDDPTRLYLPRSRPGHSLILGEAGSGKTRLAQYLTEQRARLNQRVLVIDTCRAWQQFGPGGLTVRQVWLGGQDAPPRKADVTVLHIDVARPGVQDSL